MRKSRPKMAPGCKALMSVTSVLRAEADPIPLRAACLDRFEAYAGKGAGSLGSPPAKASIRPEASPSASADGSRQPRVILVVGVNGVGKTTTIGKLANQMREEGRKPLICAADTFRAAADSQLRVWAERVGVPVVGGKEGSDPAAVAFDGDTLITTFHRNKKFKRS